MRRPPLSGAGATPARPATNRLRNLAVPVLFALLFGFLLQSNFARFMHRRNVSADGVNALCSVGGDSSSLGGFPSAQITHLCDLDDTEEEELGRGGENTDQSGPSASHQFQFDRFVMVIVDALPRERMHEALRHFSAEHQVSFRIDIPGVKYSHAVFDSYWRGQLVTNVKGDKMEGDNLWSSLARSKAAATLRPVFLGPSWPILDVMPDELRESAFRELIIVDETADDVESNTFPSLFGADGFPPIRGADRFAPQSSLSVKGAGGGGDGQMAWFGPKEQRNLNGLLQFAVRESSSLVMYSAVLDHLQHEIKPPREAPSIRAHADRLMENLKPLRDFIEAHPDYLFIMLADHGFDEDGTLHGFSRDGNEPVLMFWNPRLPGHPVHVPNLEKIPDPAPQHDTEQLSHERQLQWMRVVDVCPTLAKYLRGVDIPRNALGAPHNYFGKDTQRSLRVQLRVLIQSALSLRQIAAERDVRIDQERWESAIQRALALTQTQSSSVSSMTAAAAELRDVVEQVQEDFLRHTRPGLFAPLSKIAAILLLVVLFNLPIVHGMSLRQALFQRYIESAYLVCAHSMWVSLVGLVTYFKFKTWWPTGFLAAGHGLLLGVLFTAALARTNSPWMSRRTLFVLLMLSPWIFVSLQFDKKSSSATFDMWVRLWDSFAGPAAGTVRKSVFQGTGLVALLALSSKKTHGGRAANIGALSGNLLHSLWDGQASRWRLCASACFALYSLTSDVPSLYLKILGTGHVCVIAFLVCASVALARSPSLPELLSGVVLLVFVALSPSPAAQFTAVATVALGGAMVRCIQSSATESTWLPPLVTVEVMLIWSVDMLFVIALGLMRAGTDLANVDPRAARIGFETDDRFPVLNAFLMMLNKLGVFVTLGVWLAIPVTRRKLQNILGGSARWLVVLFFAQAALSATAGYELLLWNGATEAHDLDNGFGVPVALCIIGLVHCAALFFDEVVRGQGDVPKDKTSTPLPA